MQVPDLYIDPQIIAWVIYPILWVMLCVGVIRHFVLAQMQQPKTLETAKEHTELAYAQFATALKRNGGALGKYYDTTAARALETLRSGAILAKPELQNLVGVFNPLALDQTINQLKMQAFTYLPQTIIMKWTTLYFAGLIVLRLPFPLTPRFKDLVQSGVSTMDLDVQWVTSISWYVLLFVGVNSVLALVLPPSPPPLPPPITNDVFQGMAREIEATPFVDMLEGVEERVISQ